MTHLFLQIAPHRLTADQQHSVLIWGGILMAVVILGWSGIAILRRRVMGPPDQSKTGTPFTLADLRAMRQRGDLTEPEFEAMKAQLIAQTKGPAPAPEPPKSPDAS